ncbi:hypothetical protein PIB30_089465 [Stylosanthes scabra]|uniref:Uncharacterized protein n=1 Tax=Stylosanthes scabra TaxID=79078 RepID=A0ABU6ZSM0_9FABA|nr:hypothetical protein [Stylosanthes scabra]
MRMGFPLGFLEMLRFRLWSGYNYQRRGLVHGGVDVADEAEHVMVWWISINAPLGGMGGDEWCGGGNVVWVA